MQYFAINLEEMQTMKTILANVLENPQIGAQISDDLYQEVRKLYAKTQSQKPISEPDSALSASSTIRYGAQANN